MPDPDPLAVAESLRCTAGAFFPLEPFRPLAEGLDWRLSHRYWEREGRAAFLSGDVPYVINNDGMLSEDAARVLIHACLDIPGPLRVLEVGAGSGLFARLFLLALRRLSPEMAARTVYVASDATPAMVEGLRQGGLLAEFGDAVEFRVARAPALEGVDGPFHAILANYLLDNLPATIVRLTPEGREELLFRAGLEASFDPAPATGLDREALRARLAEGDPAAEGALLGCWPRVCLEWRAEPRAPGELAHDALLPPPPAAGAALVMHSTGALDFLDAACARLAPGGFVLAADYAAPAEGLSSLSSVLQHFGGSVASAVNFGEIDRWAGARPGWVVAAPTVPSGHLHVRLVCAAPCTAARAAFTVCLDGARWDLPGDLVRRAFELVEKGCLEDARALLHQAVLARPWSWHLLERAAAFLLYHVRDLPAAGDALRALLALNPVLPAAWNLLGDLHYERRDLPGADAAFLRAIELNPREVRARLNRSYVLVDAGRPEDALRVIGEALALDTRLDFRDSLTRKQDEILRLIGERERDHLRRQLNRVRAWAGGD